MRKGSVAWLVVAIAACSPPEQAAQPPPPDEPELLDPAEPFGAVAAHGARAVEAVATLKAILDVFVDDAATLSLTRTPRQNGDAIAARANEVSAGCAGAINNYNELNDVFIVSAAFDACPGTTGIMLSGEASGVVVQTESNVGFAVELTDMRADGFVFSGTIVVTTDGPTVTYDVAGVDVAGLGTVTFTGRTRTTMTSTFVVDGIGTLEQPSADPSIDECSASTTTGLELLGLERAVARCHASSGVARVFRAYLCGADASTTLFASLFFDAETPSTERVPIAFALVVVGDEAPFELPRNVALALDTPRAECGS